MLENELFDKISESMESVNYDENRDKSFRRYCYTWNNPFFNEEFEEVDINTTNLPIELSHYDLHNLKTEFNKDFFEFKFIKYIDYKTQEEKVIERPFFKDSNSIRDYVSNFSTFKYSCFQIEKGGNCETTHIQGFITFKNPMTWSTFKNYFPCAHFNKCISSNTDCKQYCSKQDTRIEGPFEDGEFTEERARSDCKEFYQAVVSGVDKFQLAEINPRLFMQQYRNIDTMRYEYLSSEFAKKDREVEVTYIYGPPETGKSRYVYNKYGYSKLYSVDDYRRGPFDDYCGEDVILFDEFKGQIDCTQMNRLIDRYPVKLPCRFRNKQACYTKVYIVSNLSLAQLYENEPDSVKKGFLRRIHNIIHFYSLGKYSFVKENNKQVVLDLTDEEYNKLDKELLDIFDEEDL